MITDVKRLGARDVVDSDMFINNMKKPLGRKGKYHMGFENGIKSRKRIIGKLEMMVEI